MCSFQVTRWVQDAMRWRVRRAVEIGVVSADGTGQGRRAGDGRATGWPLWPSGGRGDQARSCAYACGYGGRRISSYVLPSVPSRAPAPYRGLAPTEVRGWPETEARDGDGDGKTGETMEWTGRDRAEANWTTSLIGRRAGPELGSERLNGALLGR